LFKLIENEISEKVQEQETKFLCWFVAKVHFERVWQQIKTWFQHTTTKLHAIRSLAFIVVEPEHIANNLKEMISMLACALQVKSVDMKILAFEGILQIIDIGILHEEELQLFQPLVPTMLRAIIDALNAGNTECTEMYLAKVTELVKYYDGLIFTNHLQTVLSVMYQILKARLNIVITQSACDIITILAKAQKKMRNTPMFIETMVQVCYEMFLIEVDMFWTPKDLTGYAYVAYCIMYTVSKACSRSKVYQCIELMMKQRFSGAWNERTSVLQLLSSYAIASEEGSIIPAVYRQIMPVLVACSRKEQAQERFQAIQCMGIVTNFHYDAETTPLLIDEFVRALNDTEQVQLISVQQVEIVLKRQEFTERIDYDDLMDKLFPKLLPFIQSKDSNMRDAVLSTLSCVSGEYLEQHYKSLIELIKNQVEQEKELTFFSMIMKKLKLSVVEKDLDHIVTLLFNQLHFSDVDHFETIIETSIRIINSMESRFAPHAEKVYFALKHVLNQKHPEQIAMRVLTASGEMLKCLFQNKLIIENHMPELLDSTRRIFLQFDGRSTALIELWCKVLVAAVTVFPKDDYIYKAVDTLLVLPYGDIEQSIKLHSTIIEYTRSLIRASTGDVVTKKVEERVVRLFDDSLAFVEDVRVNADEEEDRVGPFYSDVALLAGTMVERLDNFQDLDHLFGIFLELLITDPGNTAARIGFLDLTKNVLLNAKNKAGLKNLAEMFWNTTRQQEIPLAHNECGRCLISEIYEFLVVFDVKRMRQQHVTEMLDYLSESIKYGKLHEIDDIVSTGLHAAFQIISARQLVERIEKDIVSYLPIVVSDDPFCKAADLYLELVTFCESNPTFLTPKLQYAFECASRQPNIPEETKIRIYTLLKKHACRGFSRTDTR
jgi:hypothetical protein